MAESITIEIVDNGSFRRFEQGMARLGAGQVKRALGDGLTTSTRSMAKDVAQSAERLLPRRGGLGRRVARSRYRTRRRDRTGFGDPRVAFTATSDYEISFIDQGRVAHPVFGHNTYWPTQNVPPGFFTRVTDRQEQPVRRGLVGALGDLKRIFDRIF